jgi:hypothetical protein
MTERKARARATAKTKGQEQQQEQRRKSKVIAKTKSKVAAGWVFLRGDLEGSSESAAWKLWHAGIWVR